jgi:predicted  nucleic acid-binding Zn-ribbon protein
MADARDIDWLEALEQRVHEATARLQDLAGENATLSARIADLERQLDESTPAGDEKAATAWKQERHDIRKRVERLTGDLESLLEEQ